MGRNPNRTHGRLVLSVESLDGRVLPSATSFELLPPPPASHVAALDPGDHVGLIRPELMPAELGPAREVLSRLVADLMPTTVDVGGVHLRMYWHDVDENHIEPKHGGDGHGPDA